jgi:hypothetical protein
MQEASVSEDLGTEIALGRENKKCTGPKEFLPVHKQKTGNVIP